MAYQAAIDICNRALQGCGRVFMASMLDPSPQGRACNFAYDKLRDAELRRNLWRFALRRQVVRPVDASTLIWTPPAWAATTTYPAYSVVSYTPTNLNTAEFGANPVGYYWINDGAVTGNANNATPDVSTFWHRYFGPITLEPYISQGSTAAAAPASPTLGTSVAGALGQQSIFARITYVTGNGETLPSSEATVTVPANSVFTCPSPAAQAGATGWNIYASSSTDTETLQNTNPINIGTGFTEPTTGLVVGRGVPTVAIPSYFTGELTLQGTTVYMSLITGNQDVPPTSAWLAQGGTTAPLNIVYPIGTGPLRQVGSLNVYRLPYGFLRLAPEDPTGAMFPWLGVPWGAMPKDWKIEGDYIVSGMTGPVMVRFVADVIDVYTMDPMFCEGLAARLCAEIVPVVVEEKDLIARQTEANRKYRQLMFEARMANSVLIGPTDEQTDSYIYVRL